jgi:hypothetical protein
VAGDLTACSRILTCRRHQSLDRHGFPGIPGCRLSVRQNHSSQFSHTRSRGQFRQVEQARLWGEQGQQTRRTTLQELEVELAYVSAYKGPSFCLKDEPGFGLADLGGWAMGLEAGVAAGAGEVEGIQVGAGPPPNQLLTHDSGLPSMVAVTSTGGTQDEDDEAGDGVPDQLFSQVTS